MDPKSLAAAAQLFRVMTIEQVMALAEAIDALEVRQVGAQARGGSAVEQGSVVLTVKGGRVRYLETRTSRNIGALDADGVPAGGRAGRV